MMYANKLYNGNMFVMYWSRPSLTRSSLMCIVKETATASAIEHPKKQPVWISCYIRSKLTNIHDFFL